MMRAVARLAADIAGPCDVSLEQVMGCGMGGCYSCVVLTRDAGPRRRTSSARASTDRSSTRAHRVGGADH